MILEYSPKALKILKKLGRSVSKHILDYMDEVAKLDNPRVRGKPLVGNLQDLWRFRVGNYRVLCKIKDERLVITVVDIGHRREVYNR